MIKRISTTLFIALIAISTMAHCKFDPVKFRADIHKYIAVEAKLTQKESAAFFPLYDEMLNKMDAYRKQMRSFKKKPQTEAECKKAINNCDNIQIKMKQTERLYHSKFLKVISASKLYDVLRAERKFLKSSFRKSSQTSNRKKNK